MNFQKKDSTKKLYQNNYTRLVRDVKQPFTVKNLNEYFYGRNRHLSDATVLSYLQSIVTMEDLDSGPIYDMYLRFKNVDKLNRPLKQHEKDANFSYSEVGRKFKFYSSLEPNEQTHMNSLKRIILALYWYIPPLRGHEYRNMIFSNSEIYNTMNLEDGLIIIRNSKTISLNSGKIRVIKMPKPLIAIMEPWRLKLYMDNEDNDGPDFIFGRLISASNFTNILKDIFNKPVSVNMLRKSFITEYAPNMTIAERKNLARIMGHNISTQMMTYDKNITNETIMP